MTRGLAVVWLAMGAFFALPAAGALACAGAGAQPGAVSERAYARAVECLVNGQRAAAGLSGVAHDRHLARAASGFSTAMVRQGFFDHVSPHGSTLGGRARAAGFHGGTLGEAIGWGAGARGTPVAIVEMWMNSPPHRAILLGAQFHRVGLGVAMGAPNGFAQAVTVTADFGG